MYKEIKFENQKGYGLVVTDPVTKTRALVGIFDIYAEAYKCGQDRKNRKAVLRPKVVIWNKRNYDKYDWVFEIGDKVQVY